jgi:D-galactarolactone cycloisomerase
VRINQVECFVVSHTLSPRTGPSIAYSSSHAYAIVKITDTDGIAGWGETYLLPGVPSMVETVGRGLLGRSTVSLRALLSDVRATTEHAYAASALSIALEDLRARQLGVSVATLYGGASRERVRLYAASGGYIEGRPPEATWPDEVARIRAAGFTALKLRIGRYPIAHEAPLLERIRADLPDGFDLMVDGNAAYTFPLALEMGRILHDLRFRWFEEPTDQWNGYVGYERLAQELEIALAAGEILQSRRAAREFLARGAADIVQPEPVICGGVGEALFIADLAALHGITAMPHTSNSAIGIAAALQVLAVIPDPTRSPAAQAPLLEFGVDDNPWREHLLSPPFERGDGWITIPTGPGLGVDVDEDFLRRSAIEVRVAQA